MSPSTASAIVLRAMEAVSNSIRASYSTFSFALSALLVTYLSSTPLMISDIEKPMYTATITSGITMVRIWLKLSESFFFLSSI